MSQPIAVCISDIHFNLNTLPLASQALRAALLEAETLKVPLIIAGDLQDTKAIIRAEVANEIIDILKSAKTKVYILVGNHDLINEKGAENALNYLEPYAEIIDSPKIWWASENPRIFINLIPYHSDNESLKVYLSKIGKGSIIICHQGFLGAAMGDYIQDKTSIDPELVKDFTVISGHYHRHQTIGTVTYIGSPFTMSFGEANDGHKGFLVLNSDGSFTRRILNLRSHVKTEWTVGKGNSIGLYFSDEAKIKVGPQDIVWVKIQGSKSHLTEIKKEDISEILGISNFKLDLVPTDSAPTNVDVENLTSEQVLDTLIDSTTESDQQKQYLKQLWRNTI